MATTYVPLYTTTLGSAANSVTFSSIPQTYTDLVLVSNVGSNNDSQVFSCRFNSDSSSNYSVTQLIGTGTGAFSGRDSGYTEMNLSKGIGIATTNASMIVLSNFQNYSNTTTNKTVLTRTSQVAGTYPGVAAVVGLWRSTAAISSILLYVNNGVATFNAGSTFSLYGIRAAT